MESQEKLLNLSKQILQKLPKDKPLVLRDAEIGYHYRLTDIQASLANSQLQKLDKFIVKRREIAAKYIRF